MKRIDYKIICGDALEEMAKMPEKSIDAIISDPPFAFTGGMSNGFASRSDSQFFEFWLMEIFRQFQRISKPESAWFLWCDWKTASVYDSALNKSAKDYYDRRRVSQVIVHDREMVGMGSPFRNQTDWIALIRGKKTDFKNRIPKNQPNIFREYWYYGKHENHPAEKSVSFTQNLVKWITDEDDLVFDAFAGSGTTGVACMHEKRRFIGIEKELNYFEIAKCRIEHALGNPFDIPQMNISDKPMPLFESI